MGPHRSSWRRALVAGAATALTAVGLAASPPAANAAVACEVTYTKTWEGGNSFGGNIAIRNLGDPLTSWTLTYTFTGDQQVTQGWNAEWSQSGRNVTARNMPWNGNQQTGARWEIGFNGTFNGSNPEPTNFAINGTPCTGEEPPGQEQALIVTPTRVNVPEGGTASFSVRLATRPDSNVIVRATAASSGDQDITVESGSSLTFTPSNWDTPQNVTLRAAQDDDDTNGTRTINVTSDGLDPVAVTATEVDDDRDGQTPVPGERVDNPFEGADGYVNPDWSAKARSEPGGEAVANTSTAVWLDRIAAIESGSAGDNHMGLRDHLNEAVKQDEANGSRPLTIQIVIYNLPNRDCSALASNGELRISENGLQRYKTEYIDVIADILADEKYRNLRIVTIIEIDSLPNLITNLNIPDCQEAERTGAYVEGVRYALDKFYEIPNVYNYVDAAHHGWLGWDSNFRPAAELFASTVRGTKAGMRSVHGFITNTANYSALREPYFNINTTVNGVSVRQSNWIDWNFYVDELSYAQDMRQELIRLGFPSDIGMLIDTSRNGWGGPDRPTGPSTANDVNKFVDESRVDRRIHAGNWCNQKGAGLGERPQANPEPGIDAYVWVKPPGESDGASKEIPNDEGKRFDRMCDPTYQGNDRNGNNPTGALPDAPLSGHWFSAQFQELLRNAYPPVN